MRVTLSPGNVIVVSLMAFLGIIGLIGGMKLLARTNVPVLSNIATGLDHAWMAAAA